MSLLAVSALDPQVRMLFYAVAILLFALAAIGYERGKVSFGWAGLAVATFPAFWDALAAT